MVTKLVDGGQVLSPLEEMSTPDYVSYLSTERAQRFFNAIAPAEEGDIPEEVKESHNVMVAPFGESAPFALSKPYSRVIALNTEIECVKPVTISSYAMVDGITFTSTADLDSEMVLVSGVGNMLFRNCTFVLTEDTPLRSCVKVTAPAHVLFVGCYFVRQSGSGGDAINNTTGTTNDVRVVGCIATGYSDFGDTADTASFV
jgi:hypothetical protein